jgi:hypothetical protein
MLMMEFSLALRRRERLDVMLIPQSGRSNALC